MSLVEAVQHRRHPPREALRLPDAAQARLRIARRADRSRPCLSRKRRARARARARRRRRGSCPWRRSAARCARRRRRGTAGRSCIGSTTKLRIGVTPFCRTGPSFSCQPSPRSRAARCSSLQIALVRPVARGPRRARTGGRAGVISGERMLKQREAALVVGVDQLVRGRRRLRQDAEPGERIDALEDGQHARRNRRPADAMEAVAAGDEVAVRARCASPSVRKRMQRLSASKSCDARLPRPRTRIAPPSASRAAIRSFTTSCWP